MRRPVRRSSARASSHRFQRGSIDFLLISSLGLLMLTGVAVLSTIIGPRSDAQRDAATLFASSWSRAEIEAPAVEKPAWHAYRACWVAREGRPFVNRGDLLMSWTEQAAGHDEAATMTDPAVAVADLPTMTTAASFTAEDLFDLCSRQVAQANPLDPQEPVVRAKVKALLRDRERDVDARIPAPRPLGLPAQTARAQPGALPLNG